MRGRYRSKFRVRSAVIFLTTLFLILPNLQVLNVSSNNPESIIHNPEPSFCRSSFTLGFTEISSGLKTSGDYNYIALGDFNNDSAIDIATGGEDWSVQNSVGLLAYTGNGGTSWTNTSTGLWEGNSWGGLQLADADEDGNMELYATDEDWGSKNNSGVKVWEYRNSKWTDSTAHVSTPETSGQPCNVLLLNVTGDSKLDMLVCRFNGVKYYENQGGNPVTWQSRSSGLPTSSWYTGAAIADLNKDGLKDIVAVRNDQERMWIQSESGNLWQEYSSGLSVPGYVVGVEIADVNHDSHNDIIFGSCTPSDGNGPRVWLGNSGGSDGKSFSWTAANTGLPTTRRYSQIQIADIDHDGDLDLIGPCASGSEGMKIFLGNGSEKPGLNLGWTEATNINLPTTGDWYGANVYDINGDGALDLVGASWGMGIRAWLNNITLDSTPPGAVMDLSDIDKTANSITVNWTAPSDNGTDTASGPVASYDIRYFVNPITLSNWNSAEQCAGEPAPASPGTVESVTITKLQAGTKYYIALRSSDEKPNISPLSNVIAVTTLGLPDTTPPGAITDLSALDPTNNSINLTWTASADNGSDAISGPAASYDIRYYTEPIVAQNWDLASVCATPPKPQPPGTSESFTVVGLQPETTYYFAMKAGDEKPNWGALSNRPYETTLPDPDLTAPAAVTDLSAESPTLTSIALTWTSVGDDGYIGQAEAYDIRYSKTDITDITWPSAEKCIELPAPKAPDIQESFEVTDLEPDTTYYFAVKTADENSLWSPLSNTAFNTTLPLPDDSAPAVIDDLRAESPTYSSVTLKWTAPGDDGDKGTAAEYAVRYSKETITTSNWQDASLVKDTPKPRAAGLEESLIVKGLDPNTTYYFAVKTADEKPNWSPLSNIATAKTKELPVNELAVTLIPEKSELTSNDSMKITVKVLSVYEQISVEGVDVTLSSDYTELDISSTEGVTDEDGTFIVTVTAPPVTAVTNITIFAEVSKIDFQSNRTDLIITVVPSIEKPKFNVTITDIDLEFSAEDIEEGVEVIVYANITVEGEDNEADFIVKVYVDDTQLGEDEYYSIIPESGRISIERSWNASEGEHSVLVEILPVDSDIPVISADNSAEADFEVEGDNKDTDKSKVQSKSGGGALFYILTIVMIVVFIVVLLMILIIRWEIKQPAQYIPSYSSQNTEEPIQEEEEEE